MREERWEMLSKQSRFITIANHIYVKLWAQSIPECPIKYVSLYATSYYLQFSTLIKHPTYDQILRAAECDLLERTHKLTFN